MSWRAQAITLVQVLAVSAIASAQDAPRDARRERLPISVSLPVFFAWARDVRTLGVTSGVTLSTQVSAPLAAGISLRAWQGFESGRSCGIFDGDCFWQQETAALALLSHADFYPLRARLLFFRAALGISWLREQEVLGSTIHESRSWPLTVLTGVGWDLRIRQHLFVTPLIELLANARHEPAPRTSPKWFVQTGVALTVR